MRQEDQKLKVILGYTEFEGYTRPCLKTPKERINGRRKRRRGVMMIPAAAVMSTFGKHALKY